MALTFSEVEASVLAVAGEDEPRAVTILGSTGSIGCNTVDLLAREPGRWRVEALTGNRNVSLLAEQARLLKPRFVAIADESCFAALREALEGTGIEVAAGRAAVIEAACRPADWVMAAIVGAAGLEPTLAAARRGAVVALANKECLVCAGELMMAEMNAHGATLLPVDSEHSAIFQVFDFSQAEKVERIVLTASGGPFRQSSLTEMARMTPSQAVAHPNWEMGAKISIDSATMMNKGLELIEAHHIFAVPEEKIDILVHPQSVIHSMVSYVDGSVLAQLGTPDMRTPIAYALGWPQRMTAPSPRLDLAAIASLTFEQPDPERFPALRLARQALRAGGAVPTLLNAANEVAVQSFLAGEIGFLDIARTVEETLSAVANTSLTSIEDVLDRDRAGREAAVRIVAGLSGR
ncbi:1-deoxy-D-xylulose-5-phosphate reductoisomerase [Telmatospirillum sp. J64-1]|uniref:1-deoxy-D-xylulose-5-phosphate reductoisomerase n=1 Tax=Telmatospirillum sp. J64-1 TaxID=2502183 RepID=UPI00115CCA76|nr:1-deoxy-D-xylulose-5-phosphate reductoisomerase [Telmatospirillum sp. J64-1]